MEEEVVTKLDPRRAVLLYKDQEENNLLTDHAFIKYVYYPLGLYEFCTCKRFPSWHKRLIELIHRYVIGLVYECHYLEVIELLKSRKFVTLRVKYLNELNGKLKVDNIYKFEKVPNTFKTRPFKEATNYFMTTKHQNVYDMVDDDGKEEEDVQSVLQLSELQYSESNMIFIHRFIQSVKRNGLAVFLPALVSYIRYLITTKRQIYNYSVVLFINGLLQNFLKFINISVVVEKEYTPIRYLPKSYCYGIKNHSLDECEKTFTVEICEYCFQIINVAIHSKASKGKATAESEESEDEAETEQPPTKKRKNNKPPKGEKKKKFIKRNTHKTSVYTDKLNPNLQLKCHEKNYKSILVKLFSCTTRGFKLTEIVWVINSNTKYHIKLSDDLSVINISDQKKSEKYTINVLEIPTNKESDCFQILLGITQQTRLHQLVSTTTIPVSSEKEAIFKANSCDICYFKRYYCER